MSTRDDMRQSVKQSLKGLQPSLWATEVKRRAEEAQKQLELIGEPVPDRVLHLATTDVKDLERERAAEMEQEKAERERQANVRMAGQMRDALMSQSRAQQENLEWGSPPLHVDGFDLRTVQLNGSVNLIALAADMRVWMRSKEFALFGNWSL